MDPTNRRPFFDVFVFIFLFVLGGGFPALATQNVNTELLSKSVVYLYRGLDGKPDTGLPLGTGFLVRVPLLSKPDSSYIVLVTARHMIDPAWNHCPNSQPKEIFLRFNKKNYDSLKDETGVDFALIPISENGKPTWHHPEEEDADVAVFVLNAKAVDERIDWGPIPV